MRRGIGPLALVALLGFGAGCNGVEPVPGSSNEDPSRPASPPGEAVDEPLGTARQAIAASEVLARAEEWVALAVPYCGGVNGGTDYICGGTCDRPSAPWDDYRTDCSGYVSWCWQIASNPTTAAFMNDKPDSANGWTTIAVDDLAPGDAVVCDGHIKLFSQWISDTQAEIFEEYDCGKVARKAVQSFTRSGNEMFFAGDSRTYHPIRRNGIEPLAALRGTVDAAGVWVKGWAADTKSPETPISVDVSFDGPAGEGYTVSLVASDPRPDVGDALGIDPNHGFSLMTPLYYCDGAEHVAHASGHAVEDGAATALAGSPKAFTCPVAISPKGVLRLLTADPSGAALDAWGFSRPADLRWMTPEDHATHAEDGAWPEKIALGRTADGTVYLVDGDVARRVPSAEALSAWRLDGKPVTDWTSAELAKLEPGRDLPEAPVLVQELGAPEIFVLDAEADAPIGPGPSGSTGPHGANPGDTTKAGVGGCTVSRGIDGAPLGVGVALGAIALLRRRRR